MKIKVWVIEGGYGYYLEDEESLCKLYCKQHKLTYHMEEMKIPTPEQD